MIRDQYIGFHVPRSVKAKIQREAKHRRISISALVNEVIAEKFGVAFVPTADGRRKSGRQTERRVKISSQLRTAILLCGATRKDLAKEAGYPSANELGGIVSKKEVVLTEQARNRLAKLADILNFNGPLYESEYKGHN